MLKPSQAPFTLNRFFQLLKEAVKYFNESSLELNTFICVDSYSDLSASNFNADIRKHGSDYFYSKRYDKKKSSIMEIAAPMLVVQEISGAFESLHKESNRPQHIATRLRIAVLDEFVNQKDQTGGKQDREQQQVIQDCKKTLRKVLKYLNDVKYCTITKLDASTETNYFNTKYLEYLDTNNLITSWESKEHGVDNYLKEEIQKNENVEYNIISPITGSNFVGIEIEYILTESVCDSLTLDFTKAGNDFIYGER